MSSLLFFYNYDQNQIVSSMKPQEQEAVGPEHIQDLIRNEEDTN